MKVIIHYKSNKKKTAEIKVKSKEDCVKIRNLAMSEVVRKRILADLDFENDSLVFEVEGEKIPAKVLVHKMDKLIKKFV